ncbi:glycosyltransferase family 4 protein [Saccharopolyspora mangrovi]|uniref:Glycosyltransferase family 4 protein n=1 Tax=Saccharopolyspora mangrovi TaxID=3082379 RepID=A0ABU6AJZ0_9PSEU|nr:glycosyltransferase family 4 protein [Saccharopolyspora sp. S2-29]MEB3371823.1 glycosyltransferase family 4 protein [Saccharopolyspora sp. S2-29]
MRVHFVLPDDDQPSGGNVYDRRAIAGLAALGLDVRDSAIAGTWPQPGEDARGRLAGLLAAIPDHEVVLLDGLVACGVPDIVEAHTHRLRTAILVHLPLAAETGLSPETAARLDAAEKRALRAARLVITTSPSTADELDHDHVRTALPGTEPAPVAPGTDGVTRLLCVASLTPRKGHDLLLEALADLPLTCDLVGPERDPDWARRLGEHRLGDRIRLRGPLTGAELADAYAAADLLVQPSRAETYGMAVTEALARGIPVIASAVPDALGDGGLLVPAGDLESLTRALRRWAEDAAFRDRMRSAALRRRAHLPTWESTARQLAAALASLEV